MSKINFTKPGKPYPDFPLFAHAFGTLGEEIRGRGICTSYVDSICKPSPYRRSYFTKRRLQMDQAMKISDQVTVGGQPSEDQLQQLGKQGFKSVVNFRTDGEEDQPLSPQAEGDKVEATGMTYLHVPVSMKSMGPQQVDQFRQKFPALPKPVFAHCKTGKRAGAMVMMHMAVEQGMSGEQTLQQAEKMGFKCDQPELKEFVKSYVDGHTKKG